MREEQDLRGIPRQVKIVTVAFFLGHQNMDILSIERTFKTYIQHIYYSTGGQPEDLLGAMDITEG